MSENNKKSDHIIISSIQEKKHAENPPAPDTKNFSAEVIYIPYFNLALLQNGFPVVRELKLMNHTGSDLEQLKCSFSAAPDFICDKTLNVEKIKAGEEVVLDKVELELNYKFLSELTENIKGKLKLVISKNEEILFQTDYPCEAFAPDQWLGYKVMPELIAAFVTPNVDVVAQLQSDVARELQRETGDSAVNGYQQDKKRVYEICAAIYRAIHSWGIQYSEPPASYSTPGQRIRFADTIYQYKLGTCLDTTILFASVMESCGLHPVIMFQRGHAYIGCHLEDYYFPDIPVDDLQTIRKMADLDNFLVIETTNVTSNIPFSKAEATARFNHLNIDSDFECAIDIVRARLSGISPLPLKRSINGIEFLPVERNVSKQKVETARTLEKELDLSQLSNETNQPERVSRWTKKLLDLSLRNRLLNVRDTKLVIPIACTDISILEDKIADNASFTLNSAINLFGEKDLHDLSMLRNVETRPENADLLDSEFAQRRLYTYLSFHEMNRRLTALYRQGKMDLEESGVNTLYLAIGFLEWKVNERDERSYLAPILLLPIKMQRKSIVEGIKISRFDGETIINETMLELLRSQYKMTIPGLSPLPTDESGVDVKKILQIIRQSIKNMKGWEVREEARIGHFSFGKFVMWTDMTARLEVLKQNPLIDHLISGNGFYDDGINVFPAEEINSYLVLSNLFCPMSADSSQLAAVLYSEMGKNFVLHGPPGTGKSQTITNIIAHNLALGKRVLFVSEKKAALDVVHKRLSQIGLKPFCLELHSNKSGKSEVLAQFNEALQIAETEVPENWSSTVAALNQLRSELDGYVKELHKKYPNGFSAYDCFSHLLSCTNETFPKLELEKDLLSVSAEETFQNRNNVLELANCIQQTTPESMKAFQKLDTISWSPILEKDLLNSAIALKTAIESLEKSYADVMTEIALPENLTIQNTYQAVLLLECIKKCNDTPAPFFCDEFQGKVEFISNFSQNAKRFDELKEKLKQYRLEIFDDYDFQGIIQRLEQNNREFFLIKFFKNRALLNELAPLKKSGGLKLTIAELTTLLPDALELNQCSRNYAAGKDSAERLLAKQWNDGNVDWDSMNQKIEQAGIILEIISELSAHEKSLKQKLLNTLQDIMPDIAKKCSKGSSLRKKINETLAAWNLLQERIQNFTEYSREIASEDSLEILKNAVNDIIEQIGSLRNVLRYKTVSEKVSAAGFSTVTVALETNCYDGFDFGKFYDYHYFRTLLDQILEKSPALCQFSGSNHNERINKFCELDSKYMDLTKKIIFANLAANLPRRRTGQCPEGTELGILKRECEKRARQKPVRVLLEQIPTLAPVLKPCFLMSPLSVAQYLPADSAAFDLIVFDEASQIPVWDAIGVIARGKQLIVVGDPKQMPPTNFFQKGEAEGDDSKVQEDVEDLESILDECIAAGVHSTYLNWHYRSRHESLIAFSNHHYYDDRLFTFPAARNTEKLGIRFEFVPDGVYDRKASRTNRNEAEAMVRYIFERLEKSKGNYRSIGVVTFSQAQKDLIEDLLEKERSKHPALESYFSETQEEPLFVKNLENVQGDERDVILFSICYAPDQTGKFSMNFGPLNRQGGERRLNVAITRAKEQVVVFSSIHAEQIDLSRTNAVGAAHLKYFLDYAERKINIYRPGVSTNKSDGIRDQIADFLSGKGYSVERNVGCSGFRIDIAVRHPEHKNEYLLGIECDNESYAAQNTARDRDSLRHQVLKGLGWKTYRAWSVDWAFDRKRAEKELLDYLEMIQKGSPEQTVIQEENIPQDNTEQTVTEENTVAVSANRKEYSIWENNLILNQDQFYEASGRKIIRQQIREILQKEAPIYDSLLRRRVARAWGFSRNGGNIQRILDQCIPSHQKATKYGEECVYWADEQIPEEYLIYRVVQDEKNKRAIDEIPPEELANAMFEVLIDFNSCSKEILYRETVKLFGLSAVTNKARKYLDYGFDALQKSGRI